MRAGSPIANDASTHSHSGRPRRKRTVLLRLIATCGVVAILGSPLFAQNSGLANAVDTTADLFRVHYVGYRLARA